MIREAKRSDTLELINLFSKLISEFMRVRADRDKIKTLITTAISSKQHKLLVSVQDGLITGMMLTISDGFDIAEKMYAQIRCLYSEVKGDSYKMLRLTMDWLEIRHAVQMVCYTSPIKTGVDQLLLKNKFKATGSMLVWRRYGDL